MQLVLDRHRDVPLHRQIETQIRALIESGDLAVGARLPATRGLARRLGVNRATVSTAYDALAAAGLVQGRVGHGTRIIDRGVAAAGHAPVHPRRAHWPAVLAARLEGQAPHLDAPAEPEPRVEGCIDFTGVIPDERYFPVERLRRCFDDLLRQNGELLLQYGPTRGHAPFRELVAQRMRLSGVPVSADDILVVNGAQQGLELFCRATIDPGDAVVVESPTYGNLLALLRLHRAEIVPVAMTADGIDLDELERVVSRRRVKFLYTMPHFQNPTGVTTSLEHRKRLLDIASRHEVAILEDGFEEELRWDGGEVLPLRALDGDGLVCHVGTFSKGLCPGLRIGWLAADGELVAHLAQLKRSTDFHTSLLLQAALAEFCRRGDYDKHLRRLRKIYRARMAHTAAALETHMPRGTRWRLPAGGYCVWLELPAGVDDEALVARAARDRVLLSPGRHFFPVDPGRGYVRLSISRVDEAEIESGLARVGRHLHDMVGEVRHAGPSADGRPYI